MPLINLSACCFNFPFHASAWLTVAIAIGIIIAVVGMLMIVVID